jgi:polyphosphate kinase 2
VSKGDKDGKDGKKAAKKEYERQLYDLQVELVKLQRHMIAANERLLVIVEGRDGGGKDGLIRRLTRHLSPRETRVVALGKPSDRDRASWYFQRYVRHLPSDDHMVLFNRSWYNRAGVEPVMGFCTEAECAEFLAAVVPFERMLQKAGIRILKYYLDISRQEQAKRLAARRADPLKQWKISPIDEVALAHYDDYTQARDRMLEATSDERSPWFVVRADDKKAARLNVIRHLLASHEFKDQDRKILTVDDAVLFRYDAQRKSDLAR